MPPESTTGPLDHPVDVSDPVAAQLDPLGVDGVVPALWEMNAADDVNGLVGLLRTLVPAEHVVAGLSLSARLATMRDLGLFLGSIKRCGVEPLDMVPELEAPLVDLGARTGMAPRDTIFHYIGWNPTGSRERMYTGNRMERMLVSSVRVTLPRLISAVEHCRRLTGLDPGDPEFAATMNEVVALVRSLEDSINIVTENVTPEFFARTMRPYFESVRIGAVDHLGPAAAHVPLYLVDLALWASDGGDDAYDELWRESARYGLPPFRPLHRTWAEGPSVVTRVSAALRATLHGPTPPFLHASAEALCRALHALVVFRGKHLTVARRAYADDVGLYDLGSGGGSVHLLETVTSLSRENASSMRRSIPHGPRVARTGAGR